jgi:lipid-A-disaccharide synthase
VNSTPLRIAVAAGEASGDTLGAGLIEALRDRCPSAEFMGIAGPRMIAAGCEPWNRTEELSVMGLAEVVRHLPRLLKLRKRFIQRLLDAHPDVFIGIDSPDFNLPVEAALKRAGVTAVQYVSPQVWAWRQSRVASIRESTDLVLCVLPFETQFYERHGVNAIFVGHPLADEIPLEIDKLEARRQLSLPADATVVAILPGSRANEVSRLARPFSATAKWLQGRHEGLLVVVALTNESTRDRFAELTSSVHLEPPAQLVVGQARAVMAASDVVLTASGTATLETALHKRPMVVAYIISGLTHRLLRIMGLNKLAHFSLPNLLAGGACVPEFLQSDVRPDVLGPSLEQFLSADSDVDGLCATFAAIHSDLRRDASHAAAAAIVDLVSAKNPR